MKAWQIATCILFALVMIVFAMGASYVRGAADHRVPTYTEDYEPWNP